MRQFYMPDTGPTNFRPTYIHFAVIICHSFPIDMLRYDRCTPHSEQDADEIERSLNDGSDIRRVCVQRYSEERQWERAWTFDRWRSFCCKIEKPSIVTPVETIT